MLAFEEKKKSPAMIKVVGVGGGSLGDVAVRGSKIIARGSGQGTEHKGGESPLQRLALEVLHHRRVLDRDLGAHLDRRAADGSPGFTVPGFQAQVGIDLDILDLQDLTGQGRRGFGHGGGKPERGDEA